LLLLLLVVVVVWLLIVLLVEMLLCSAGQVANELTSSTTTHMHEIQTMHEEFWWHDDVHIGRHFFEVNLEGGGGGINTGLHGITAGARHANERKIIWYQDCIATPSTFYDQHDHYSRGCAGARPALKFVYVHITASKHCAVRGGE
jgi:hypothetical protein